MSTDVKLPKLTKLMQKGTIVKWLKTDGERIEEGENLVVITTEKKTVKIKSSASGILKVNFPKGSSIKVGDTICQIRTFGKPMYYGSKSIEVPTKRRREKKVDVTLPHLSHTQPMIKATPLARKLAKERGINLSKIKGTGPRGSITKEDVISHMGNFPTP